MGASDRFLFSSGTAGTTARVLTDATPARPGLRVAPPSRSPTVLQRCRGPVQLSLFSGVETPSRPGPT